MNEGCVPLLLQDFRKALTSSSTKQPKKEIAEQYFSFKPTANHFNDHQNPISENEANSNLYTDFQRDDLNDIRELPESIGKRDAGLYSKDSKVSHKLCGESKSKADIDNEIECTFKPKINDVKVKQESYVPIGFDETINRLRSTYFKKLENQEKQKYNL